MDSCSGEAATVITDKQTDRRTDRHVFQLAL